MNDFISFPALNLKFGISDTIFSFRLFGVQLELRWYGLLIAIGFLLAVVYAMRRVKQFDIDSDRMIDVVLVCAIFAFLGARIYYVLFAPDRADFFDNPLSILQVWKGGLAVYGGIIFAFITAIWMCRVRKVNTLSMFDLGSLGFLIGQSIGRWGNFFNQEAFGGNTSLPWGMTGSIIQRGINGEGYDPSLPVHPTFLYESLWCALGFVLLHLLSKKAYKFKGQIFSLYIVWYGLGRFMIESLRTDSLMLGATMKVSMVVAGLSVLGGAALYFLLRSHHNSLPVDLFEETPVTIPLAEELTGDGSSDEIAGETNETDEDVDAVEDAPAEAAPDNQDMPEAPKAAEETPDAVEAAEEAPQAPESGQNTEDGGENPDSEEN
jgi:phosphatidylglycerol:prolipoprotein diacylglycerol transferase